MSEWILSICLATLCGSMMYGAWFWLERYFRREAYLQMIKTCLNVVVIFFTFVAFFSVGIIIYMTYIPGTHSWTGRNVASMRILGGLTIIWLIGAVVRFGRYLYYRYLQFRLAKTYVPCDGEMQDLFQELCREIGIRRNIQLVQSYAIPTARLEGFFKIRICLPAASYEVDTLKAVLVHELMHYKHQDRWIQECAILVAQLHWFNPLIRHMHGQLERWQEFHCDYSVCQEYGLDAKRYAQALAEMAQRQGEWNTIRKRASMLKLNFFDQVSCLKERVNRILRYDKMTRPKKKVVWIACFCFWVFGVGTALAAGGIVEEAYGKLLDATWEEYAIEEEMQPIVWAEEIELSLQEVLELQKRLAGKCAISLPQGEFLEGVLSAGTGCEAILQLNAQNQIILNGYLGQRDMPLKILLVEPNGMGRYVECFDPILHTFIVNQTGEYHLYLWNETETDIEMMMSCYVIDMS